MDQRFYLKYEKTLSSKHLLILDLLVNGMMSTDNICLKMSIPRTTVYDNLMVLWNWGFVEIERVKEKNGKPGAPKTFWLLSNGSIIDFTGRKRKKQFTEVLKTYPVIKTFF